MNRHRVSARSSIAALLFVGCLMYGERVGAITCTVSASGINFLTYDPTSLAPRDASGTVTVNCTGLLGLLVSWTVLLSTGGSGNFSARQMSSGAHSLSYNIYTSSAYTGVWGDGTGGTQTNTGGAILVLGGVSGTYTSYGRIAAMQDVAAGSYADTITVTVNY